MKEAVLPTYLPTIARGRAIFVRGELRCAAPRADEAQRCNKLIAKINVHGMIAGNFRCERCKADIEIRLVPTVQTTLKPQYSGKQAVLKTPRFGETQHQNHHEVSPL